jgi:hypothetical protein
MVVAYLAKWITLFEAIHHVQRVLGGPLKDARDKLLIALREGAVTARYHGKDIGGIAAHYEGTGGGVPPTRWYKAAAVFDDGSVEFSDNPDFPFPRPLRLREQIEVRRSDLERWWPVPPTALAEESTTDSPTKTISLIEAVHELREVRHTDLGSAIGEMINMLATGQVPPVSGLVDNAPARIEPIWWWASVKIEYPNSSAVFNLVADGEPRITRVTEIGLDREAWERRRVRIATARQADEGRRPPMAEGGRARSTGSLAVVLEDLQLREAFVEVCRAGRVRAEGRRIRYRGAPTAEGVLDVTTSVENEYQHIPTEDWRDLMFSNWGGELRLEGTRRWFTPAPAFEPKGWAFIRISERALLDFIEDAQRRRDATETAAPGSGSVSFAAGAAPIEAQPSTTSSRIHIPTKREALASWVAARYAEGIPAGVGAKKIARDFENDKKISVDVRTVRRALGRH